MFLELKTSSITIYKKEYSVVKLSQKDNAHKQ